MVSNDVTIAIHPILFYCKECIPIKRSYNVDVIISGKLCNTSLLYRSSLVKKTSLCTGYTVQHKHVIILQKYHTYNFDTQITGTTKKNIVVFLSNHID